MARKRSSTPRREPLNRERVLRAALALADAGGVEALSMRRLGQELGVEAMSLYNHVASKDDLLSGIADLALAEIELPEGGDWKGALRRHAVSAHEVFRRHPWACQLTVSPAHVPARSVRRADWMLARLAEGGLPPDAVYHAYHALDAHIIGFTLWELGHTRIGEGDIAELAAAFARDFPLADYPHMHSHVRQHMDGVAGGKGAFELVLDLILDGLAARGKRPRGRGAGN